MVHDRNSNRFLVVLVVLVFLLSAGRVFLANWLVESSDTLRRLDSEIAQQTTQNQNLAAQIRQSESLSLLENQAQAAGFVQTSKISFILPEPNVAFRL